MKAMAKLLSTAEKLKKLKLFNDKIGVLRRRNFIPQVFRPDHGFTLKMDFETQKPQEQLTLEKRGADEEALHAFVTTLRFFVQPKDGIKIEQIAEIYESLPVEEKAKQSARAAADGVNSYLDSATGLNFYGENITRRRLFEVFMYGNLAHANDDKRSEYETWMQHPLAAAIMPTIFEETIAKLTECIFSFQEMNERTIRQLGSTAE
jgi:hypothetical protein